MGRLDVRARSLELLLTEPASMRVLEVNGGFTAAAFHSPMCAIRFRYV
jgi:hypothetical protein